MIRAHKKSRGQSVIEFAALIVFLLAAFIVFQKYIVRGFSGRWKVVGDSLGQGRIYDPNMTVECAANTFTAGVAAVWYNQTCFEENCAVCHEISSVSAYGVISIDTAGCTACITACQTPYCDP